MGGLDLVFHLRLNNTYSIYYDKIMKKKHILMIDDDSAIQRLFGAKFSAAGYEVLYASDGDSGREMARRFMPDVILLDVRMPKTDGYTVARRLKTEQ